MTVKTNTGYSTSTPTNLLLDAGVIYKDLTFDSANGTFSGTLLGATSGGNEFTHTQELRQIEVDGVKVDAKSMTIIDSERAEMVVNLKELTAQSIKDAIAGSNIDTTDTNFDIITSNGEIADADYITNISFVGKHSGSDNPVVIMLKNALSVNGLNFTPTDNEEEVVPITFRGHSDATDVESNIAPYEVYWPKLA